MKNNRQRTPFIIGFDGTALNRELEHHLLRINPTGLLFFKRNIHSVKQTRKLIRDLHNLLGEIIVAVDHEGGIVNRFPAECPVPPSPAALNSSGSVEIIKQACRLQAELVAYLGFNMNFAPLVDLALYPENHVIGTRAFSENARKTADYARTCIEEHVKLKIGTTAKHFPTHGRTITDSHFAVGTVVHENREQLEQDLLPYRMAIGCNVPAIMTAHLTYPFLDEDCPASLSKPILSDLLREQLGFQGLIISDCVEMEGLSRNYEPQDLVELGLNAGVDLFISSFSLKRSYNYQSALIKGFDKMVQDTPHLLLPVETKIDYFINHFPSGSKSIPTIPNLNLAIEIHKKTLEKKASRPISPVFNTFYLVELASSEKQGINPDDWWNTAAKEILKHCDAIAGSQQLSACDIKRLRAVIHDCNTSGKTCVLLTADGYRKEGYSRFVETLKDAISAIHIALASPDDLKNCCNNEWLTHGYNSCTGMMLADELNCLV